MEIYNLKYNCREKKVKIKVSLQYKKCCNSLNNQINQINQNNQNNQINQINQNNQNNISTDIPPKVSVNVWVEVQKKVANCNIDIWKISDMKLARHMSFELYQAFYQLIMSSTEQYTCYDFDPTVLKIKFDQMKTNELITEIKTSRVTDYITLWREIKATLASAMVLLSSFDWFNYQYQLDKIMNNCKCTYQYLLYTLTFINKKNCLDLEFAQHILTLLKNHKKYYRDDILLKFYMGFENVERYVVTNKKMKLVDNFVDDTPWYNYFLIIVIIFFVMLLIVWIGTSIRIDNNKYHAPILISTNRPK